jgi:hypothetical protein
MPSACSRAAITRFVCLTLVALHPDHADGFGGLGPAAALATGVAVYGGLAPAGPSRADYRNETSNLRLTPEIPESVV